MAILTNLLLTNCGNVFSNETYQDSIEQNIGGLLIRNIHHSNDQFSYQYSIEYFYKKTDSDSIFIGYGLYHAERPPDNEQILKTENRFVFKTSGYRNDLLFIYDDSLKVWIKHEISPQRIEETELWKNLNINSCVGNYNSFSRISKIDENGYITIWYIYARGDKRMNNIRTGKRKTDQRKIIYKINPQTGIPEIVEISKN